MQLQDGLSKILLPPHSFTVLFWIALCSWFIGILSIFISSVFSVENANVKFWANIVAHLGLLLGMGDLYLPREVFGLLITPLSRTWNLVGRVCLLSEICR